MTHLALGNLVEAEDLAWLVLSEGALPASLVQCEYQAVLSQEPRVEETLLITLQGSHAEMRQVISRLEKLVYDARRYAEAQQGWPVYLRVRTVESSGFWYARVLALALEGLPDGLWQHERGSLTLKTRLTRENHFDSEEVALPLSNSGSSGNTSGLVVLNHKDGTAGHDNRFVLPTSSLGTDLPCPLRLELTNTYSQALGDVRLGGMGVGAGVSLPRLQWEAEAMSGGSPQNSAACSNGQYTRFSWAGTGWQALGELALPAQDLTWMGGGWYQPLLRLAAPAAEDLLLELSVWAAGSQVHLGAPITLKAGAHTAWGSPFRLPCADLPLALWAAGHQLKLRGFAPSDGAHTLNLDFIGLLPQERGLTLRAISGLAVDGKLTVDAFSGRSWSVVGGQETRTHQVLGDGLLLDRGSQAQVMLVMSGTQGEAPIDQALSVKAWYRKRRRVL